jgi:hypothetical protein
MNQVRKHVDNRKAHKKNQRVHSGRPGKEPGETDAYAPVAKIHGIAQVPRETVEFSHPSGQFRGIKPYQGDHG